ncbi:MAG: hypothetical protein H6837_17710 [Planctomycetes bacterium]|nr:hypothetical protein [Planctomycetota bacterium]
MSHASPAAAAQLFPELWPEARVVCDEAKVLYTAFGVTRGGLGQVLGPRVWLAGARALLAGHGVGRPSGDVWQMSGAFLVRAGRVLRVHRYAHSADHPDFDAFGSTADLD